MAIGFSSPPNPFQKVSIAIPPIMVLTKCHPTRLFQTTPSSIPSVIPRTSKAKEVDINLIKKLTFFVLLRTFWSWFKMEWTNKHFNNAHSVTLKKWINFFYIFGLISGHLSRKKSVSCSSFMELVDFSLKIQNNWFNFRWFFWILSNFY